MGGSFAALKANFWFSEFDWDKLYNKEMKPPHIPNVKKIMSDEEMKKME